MKTKEIKTRESQCIRPLTRSLSALFILKLLPVVFSGLIVSSQFCTAQSCLDDSAYNRLPFKNGERLQYKVGWGFIRLGTVTFEQERTNDSSALIFHLAGHAWSAAWLPFVHVDLTNSAILRSYAPSNLEFRFDDSTGSRSWAVYKQDSVTHVLSMVGMDNGKDTISKQVSCREPCYDALGFFMLLRALSGTGLRLTVPVIMAYDLKPTEITMHKKIEEINIGLSDKPILAYRFETRGKWTDPHSGGTKADIVGWISADSSAVPLLVKMKIFIGSIDVELESCSRTGWVPPTDPSVIRIRAAQRAMR